MYGYSKSVYRAFFCHQTIQFDCNMKQRKLLTLTVCAWDAWNHTNQNNSVIFKVSDFNNIQQASDLQVKLAMPES